MADTKSSSIDEFDDMVYDSEKEDQDDIKQAKPGMIPAIKNLYPGEKDDLGRYTTTDKIPKDLPQPEETEETSRYALLIRNNKCYDGRKSLTISSIVVQSPLLKKVLCWVLKDYPCMAPELDRLEVVSPFRPFVHRWQRLTDALNDEKDPETKSHIQLFYDALKKELEVTLEARDDFINHRTITFNSLWMIFEPGDIIFTIANKRPIAAKLKTASIFQGRHEDIYRLECDMIYGNGDMFGLGGTRFDILDFDGMMKIKDLSVFPLKYHQDVDKIEEKLLENGKKYEKMMGFHHVQYKGVALDGRQPFYVDSRIVLDPDAYKCYNPDHDMILKPLHPNEQSYVWSEGGTFLTDDQHLICGSSVKGYSLRNKRWLDFFVDTIKDIEWDKQAWDNVVLESEMKDLIFELTSGHRINQGLHSKGLNILLSGYTGTGKTFIVKSLAETLRAPLFHITPADVDLDPKNPDLESPFTDILEMCGRWNAILLFDQARPSLDNDDDDESREYSQLLDALESHSAALFVTCDANAEDCMDERLQSRFHICLDVPNLNSTARGQIWQKCLESQKNYNFFVDSKELAGWIMNGREIANAVTAAKTLALNGRIEMKHLDRVVSANKKPRPIEFSDDEWCEPPKKEKPKKFIYDSLDGLKDEHKEVVKSDHDDKHDQDLWSAWGSTTKKHKKKVSVEEPIVEILPKEPTTDEVKPIPINEDVWGFGTKKDKKKKDEALIEPAPAPEEPVQIVSDDVKSTPANEELEWWSFATKKDKKKKVEETIIEPVPAPEEPASSAPAEIVGKKENFDWGTWGLNAKDKKKKKAPVEEALTETASTNTVDIIDVPDDNWGVWGFGTKKDKKKKKAVLEEPVIKPVSAIEEPAKTDAPAVTEPQEDDWGTWGGFGIKKDKKKKKNAAVKEPVPAFISNDTPVADDNPSTEPASKNEKLHQKKPKTKKWSQNFTKEEFQAIDDGDGIRMRELGIIKAVVVISSPPPFTSSHTPSKIEALYPPVEYEVFVKEVVEEDDKEEGIDQPYWSCKSDGKDGESTRWKLDGKLPVAHVPKEYRGGPLTQTLASCPAPPSPKVEVETYEWASSSSSSSSGKKGKKCKKVKSSPVFEDAVTEQVEENLYDPASPPVAPPAFPVPRSRLV